LKCPYCGNGEDKVIDSRESSDGGAIRRRRECLKCERRTTTYERVEQVPILVVKRDGRRESFDRKKLINGIMKACEKRPVSLEQIEELIDQVEREIAQEFDREVASVEIGERVMRHLHQLDEVAYVRFASVYRSFKDISQFMGELRDLLKKKQP
jgi:transcriptional repressor NrdR